MRKWSGMAALGGVIAVFLSAVPCGAHDQPRPMRAVYDFDPGWRLLIGDPTGAEKPEFDDSAWKPVTLPHAWNEDSAFKVAIHDLPTGIAWYRKRFQLPPGAKAGKVFLEFEGIRQAGEFWVNGTPVGGSENGVMAFGLDITDAVKPYPAENVIAARIDNAWNYHEKATGSGFEWNDRNFYANYGGINKNVRLHITGRLYQTLPLYSNLGTTGVYVYADGFDIPHARATVTAESEVKNDSAIPHTFGYSVRILGGDGKPVKEFAASAPVSLAPGATTTVRASSPVEGLRFWSWGYGALYDVVTELTEDGKPVDTVHTRTGFRQTEFVHGMVRLNGHVIDLHGYGQRTTNEWPAIGLSVPPWMSDLSNRMIVEGGGNLIRWMHVTPWKQDVESCDRVGLIESMPAGDSEKDVAGRRWQQRLDLMRDAMIYNRNNPSILFYESGNNEVSEEHMKDMKALRDRWDPHGGRASGSRNMQGSHEAEYGGEMLYINKSATKPMWAMEYSRDEALRKWWDEQTPPYHKDGATAVGDKEGPAYNRNQDSFAREDVTRWYDYWRERPGTGTRVNAGGVNIIFSDSNTHYRGDQSYRRSGEVDAVRLPKDAYFAHQVMWDGWLDPERPRAFLLGHWNYAPGVKKDISVVSSAERVELFLNGKSLGAGERSSHFLFTWPNVAWKPGTLRAVGYDGAGNPVCTTERTTAGPPAALRLKTQTGPGGLRADGADIALIDVEVVDAHGNRCPTALNPVTFTLSGPAEWRGGIAQDDDRPDNYILAKTLPVQCGVNRVLVRSLPTAGTITLRASASGLTPATVSLTSHPIAVTAGLAAPPPILASYLGRGPTPPGDGLPATPERRAVPISSVHAGSNPEKAALAFDDDETTSWTNDGSQATAWIEFTLARPAQIKEMTLKMGGWRNRSYPIRITVDGREAFVGETPRSLGYVTLPLKPVPAGTHVRISLAGRTRVGDGFDIVEVTGKKDETASASEEKGTLTIIEAEVYEDGKKRVR